MHILPCMNNIISLSLLILTHGSLIFLHSTENIRPDNHSGVYSLVGFATLAVSTTAFCAATLNQFFADSDSLCKICPQRAPRTLLFHPTPV